ncbi:MAG: lipid-A-disaccharide synthase [Bdellovibrionales bacterium RIFOXYD12_FULL_39_22]|nr:MAG: lipid-A-disaccharide synthase [Bdellovibrionales bacterium RIFOXYB1_FULL_39_21]OFZ41578.1 MAG: lipid-A-disaccharide synthase [Bdellovibrionales bacterium RIFOXYC12_FULL_39_17]OFZ45891.1 MAG: lipid-A-disaccharide synthase [Bdellovibrionales bacterium RIFOXYC1_FULL_39_130]OFZ74823.1 MAG: lipid-A-disaccharide synthase [Bdellovibrionales bacterium RIFOXYD1_FULL_39_84]OFZ92683.1 MAG: lipid-A-disaccharide synthase [Bdellovibrionales bacterium RIFOXYD12_FULL_39_22]HLE11268.1 lipid-A-disacchar
MKKNCLIIAGEKSGEEHALSFLSALSLQVPDFHFWGVGGDEMQAKGVELVYHLKDFSSWGFSEVVAKIPFYLRSLSKIEAMAVERECRVAILIDFQDYNLHLAKRLKKLGVAVLYYVAPQAWAWKSWRGKKIGQVVHTLFTILPFEKEWFKKRGSENVKGVMHPLILRYKKELAALQEGPIRPLASDNFNLLLLPGSRSSEVANLLPDFIKAADFLKEKFGCQVFIVKSPSVDPQIYQPFEHKFDKVFNNTELASALLVSDCAIAASGTVTLTTALFAVPTVVCYKTSLLNEFIYKTFVNYSGFFSLANIIHQSMVFPELIQDDFSDFNILNSLLPWITEKDYYWQTKELLLKTGELLSGDDFDLANYMAQVLSDAYMQKVT